MTNPDEALKAIEGARVRLRSHVHISEQNYRGDRWFVVSDRMNTTHFRCAPDARFFLSLLDGNRTVGEALAISRDTIDPAPTAAEVVRLLAHLRNADMLQGDFEVSADEYRDRRLGFVQKRWTTRLTRPLAIQLPLLDPHSVLEALLPIGRLLFSRQVFAVWGILILLAVGTALSNADELVEHFSSRFLDPTNLFLLWLIYPVIKLFHEFGHGLATRVYGGEVHELGIILLVLVPVPYVDASASSEFVNKTHRMIVAAAGILVEMFLAAIALFLWAATDSGMIHDLAFDIALIGGISTVLFNGNPLVKFDGYYVLSDLIEIPSLATRSARYIGYLVKSHVFRLQNVQSPVTSPGEKGWFIAYGLTATCYRLFITVSIALFVASRFFILGILLAIWFLAFQFILPLSRNLLNLLRDASSEQRLPQTALTLLLVVGLPLVLLFTIPVGHGTYAEGIIVVPEQAIIRTETAGFVTRIPQAQQFEVHPGDILATLNNDELIASEQLLSMRVEEAHTRYAALLGQNRVQLAIARDEMEEITAEHNEIKRQLESLDIVAPSAGLFWNSTSPDLQGHYLKRGAMIGFITNGQTATARIVVPQDAVNKVLRETADIEVRLASDPRTIISAQLIGEVPQATDQLPSRALGTSAGGDITVDMRDARGATSLAPLFVVDLLLPEYAGYYRIGQKVLVRFRHQAHPLGQTWLLKGQDYFINQLSM